MHFCVTSSGDLGFNMHQYHIAPMMAWTDRHFRYLMRLLGGADFLLFTEMVTVNALHYSEPHQYLEKSDIEGDVILQIGGSDLDRVAQAIQLAEQHNYAGYNLNVGCPSDRVQNAKIGACLMAEGPLVQNVLKVMMDHTDKPVSIKTRVGIDGVDSYDYFRRFVDDVLPSGCTNWIVHARDAWLKGLSPRQNRSIPPLRYEYVYQLKKEMPELNVTINGGFTEAGAIKEALSKVDSVMLGRAAYQNPKLIHELGNSQYAYKEALNHYIQYIRQNIHLYPVRRLAAPLVIALSGYYGAKHDRAKVAACKEPFDMLNVLDGLHLHQLDEISS